MPKNKPILPDDDNFTTDLAHLTGMGQILIDMMRPHPETSVYTDTLDQQPEDVKQPWPTFQELWENA